MSICYELKKDPEEIAHWPLSKIVRWIAFFRVRKEEMDELHEKAMRKRGLAGQQANPKMGVGIWK